MSNRLNKIDEEIVKTLSTIFREEVKDPRIDGMITISEARITKDFSHCNIYVSIFNSKNRDECFKTIKDSSGFLRKKLAERVDLRVMPELHFHLDETLDYVDKMNDILKQI